MIERTVTMHDGRDVGVADYGPANGVPVVWCHGGPGSRLEPAGFEPFLDQIGVRVIGIDRPGYGNSTLRPGRSIADWVPDALAVVDHLGIDRFLTIGMSTGGAYALAVAALAPDRVRGVILGCAMTDMRHEPSRASMSPAACQALWNAPDRDTAIEMARAAFGDDGSTMMENDDVPLCAADLEFLRQAADDPGAPASMAARFANGVEGYVDDRLADGPGWVSFDVTAVRCPVVVVHGADDTIVDPVNARHTTMLIPHASLRIEPGHGHLSVGTQLVTPLLELIASTS